MNERRNTLTIGQFANASQLSLKALRLYEQHGILRPATVDPDSRYRYYHLDQVKTAVFIRLLRQMEMPLAIIQRVLQASDEAEASKLVWQHQQNFAERAEQVRRTSWQVLAELNHKEFDMNDQVLDVEIRIEQLPPLRVARFYGEGTSPEGIALDKLAAWAEPQGLLDDLSYRLFGFNNPSPSPDKPTYGYEAWITINGEVSDSDEASIHLFEGGLYAVTRVRGVENIGKGWQRLQAWHKESGRVYGQQQWLEEHLSPLGGALDELQLDLFFPLAA